MLFTPLKLSRLSYSCVFLIHTSNSYWNQESKHLRIDTIEFGIFRRKLKKRNYSEHSREKKEIITDITKVSQLSLKSIIIIYFNIFK